MSLSAFHVFQKAALLILTPQCFEKYFLDFNFFDVPCFSATLSKVLGLGIILGSITVKVPQILKLLKNKSGEGINIYSVSLDLTAITIYMSYSFVMGFPFSSWGDTSFLAIQTIAIAVLVLYYSEAIAQSVIYLILYIIICFLMMSGVTPLSWLWTLQTCNIPIVVSGKLIQAYTNYKNGHTGQLSAVTLFMLFFGSAARIFTSIQETGDLVVILTYIASTLANFVLVIQMIAYWNVPVGEKKKTD